MSQHNQCIYDVFQWIAVAAIMLTVIVVIVIKIIKFNKQLRSGKDVSCNCGCSDRNGCSGCTGCNSCSAYSEYSECGKCNAKYNSNPPDNKKE